MAMPSSGNLNHGSPWANRDAIRFHCFCYAVWQSSSPSSPCCGQGTHSSIEFSPRSVKDGLLGVLQHLHGQVTGHSREALEEFFQRVVVFETFEKGLHRDARSAVTERIATDRTTPWI